MKTRIITFLVSFIVMGLAYGLILYFFKEEQSTSQIIYQALFFGVSWGLAEVFVFPWVRKKFGKERK